MSHAKLSPSAADRWMTCPGSVVLSEGMPEKSSAFAEEGTQAHEVAENLLSAVAHAADVPAEMLAHLAVYVDHVTGLGGERHVEQRVHVNDAIYGTADAVVWQPDASMLHIVDLKYGAGVAVEVVDNLQLKIYALATLLTFKYPATQVTATIVQPRCPHSDGPVRSVTYDVVELLDFHADLGDAEERVRWARISTEGPTNLNWQIAYTKPSEKGCRWCLAAPKCPALKNKAQTLAKQVFAPGLPYDPRALAETLDFLPILDGWSANVREFAYAEAERGNEIPNWKLVEKRATRKWRDENAAAEAIVPLIGADAAFEHKLLSPAAMEKCLPKEKRDVLDELCVKESSGHTLVHESDNRPAVRLDAKSAFQNL